MTENISEEELLLIKRARRRLVGAITLVVAAFIILPLIFDEEPEIKKQEVAINFPAGKPMNEPTSSPQLNNELTNDRFLDGEMDTGKEILEPVPFKPAASEEPEKPEKPAEVATELAEALEKKNNIPVPAAKPQKKEVTVNEEQVESIQTPVSELKVFVVQLGAFSDHAKARHQQQNLVSHGIRAYTERSRTSSDKEMMRVRVGPFSTRIAAEHELVKLRELGLDGVVTAK